MIEGWREWVTLRTFERSVSLVQERRRVVLEDGFDVIAGELARRSQIRSAA